MFYRHLTKTKQSQNKIKMSWTCLVPAGSISIQAVVGGNLKFLHIATGYPGSTHDAHILRDSALYIQAKRTILLIEPTDVIDGYKIRPLPIGDRTYAANTWLAKPFPSNLNLSQEQKKLKRFLSSARVAVERDFGILKARWRCLLNCLDHNIDKLSDVIISCCVLHNICQMKGDSWINNDDVLEHTLLQDRERRTQRKEESEIHASDNTSQDILTDYVNADNCEML